MDIYRQLQRVYNTTIRDKLPVKDRTLAGVRVRDTPLFDLTADNPLYKVGLLMAIYDHVSDGDRVEIVGFGRGVSTIHALRAGATEVTGYEASPKMIEKGTKTVGRNYAGNASVEVRHAIVGASVDIYGDAEDAKIVHPSELSQSDVLVLDCEGAEISILSDLGSFPRSVICESHPTKGAPESTIVNILQDEYQVSIRNHHMRRNSKKIIIGVKNST